ncbi:MAG: peptidoglycan-binding protein [Chloroflexota bacterium]|nr:peptidoglycan-binding protein [Chloroflexota bacterium]
MIPTFHSPRRGFASIALTLLVVLISLFGIATPTSAGTAYWTTEREGNVGPNVKAVQFLLRQRGHSLTADGHFGSITKSAVISFQKANGLTADGIVGSNTWSKLILTVREGNSGEAVKAAQTLLVKNGRSVTVDGAFGPATKSATISFQQAHALTADGIIGPNTWQHLVGSGNSSGSTTRAQLGAQIRDNSRIHLLTSHVSGIYDPGSTASANIKDTANGLRAKTSSYSDVGTTNVWLDTRMLNGMLKLANSYTFRVTAIAGGDHSSTSRHYAGLAFDVDMINGSTFSSRTTTVSNFMQRCRDLGANEVLGPGDTGHSRHIHCAWPR